MKYNYEFLRKCHGLRFRATIDDKQEEGIIKVAPNNIVLCYGEPNPGNLMTFERWRALNVYEEAFNRLPKDFEIVPRDPETYTDWQVGDKIIIDEKVRSVIFRCGEVVLFKDSDNRCCVGSYSCEELYADGYSLVLTDVEKEILEEKKCVEDTPKTHEFREYDPVLVRDKDIQPWILCAFQRYNEGGCNPYLCKNGSAWKQCIPYNEETMHLLGTTERLRGGRVMSDIEKKFLDRRTGRIFPTLKAAKAACKSPYVERVWLQDGKIIGRCTVYAYGETRCNIRSADENIAWALKREEERA